MADAPIPRLADARLAEVMESAPAVAIAGARAIGKTTTAMAHARSVIAADQPAVRTSLTVDPDLVLRESAHPVVVDEWQMAPDVIGAVKRAVDQGASPGSILITGSADPRAGMHAAAGRVVRIPMHPLTQLEIESANLADLAERAASLAITRLLSGNSAPFHQSTHVTRNEVIDRILASGFPGVVRSRMGKRLRAEWFDSYLSSALTLDPDAGPIDGRRLRRYVDAVRATSGMLVTDQSLREAADVATNTARNYQDLLERIHIVESVPAWGDAVLASLLKSPKRFVVDAALTGVSRERLEASGSLLGPVLESFVHAQLAPLGALGPVPFDVYHLRTTGGQREIDFILQTPAGAVVVVEVKSAAGASVDDARHLAWLRAGIGERFLGGIVLHLGSQSSLLSERIWGMPIDCLWNPLSS